jgi:sodium-dependent dicarboxylate transporter 2/3/5
VSRAGCGHGREATRQNGPAALRGAPPVSEDVEARHIRSPAGWLALGAGLAGPLLWLATLLVPAPAGLSEAAWQVAGLTLWMACWWIAQPVPLAATALLPIVVLPAAGSADVAATAAQYAHPIIYLFLGGFLVALAIERCGLHRRIALSLLARLGTRPAALVAGFMAVSALLSMWISNTATTLMLLPVGVSVLGIVDPDDPGHRGKIAPALLLGIAYGASLGGIATLVGTPPNALVAAFLQETYDIQIGFARWMAMALPLSLVMLVAGWLLLTRVIFRLPHATVAGARSAIAAQRRELGPMGPGERRVAIAGTLVALAWMIRPLLQDLPGLGWLSDTAIALIGAVILFVVPLSDGRRALDWESTRALPWGVLVLVGGGLALADAIAGSGLGAWLAATLDDASGWPLPVLVLVIVAAIVLLTEVTSNTATAATFVPLVAALATGANLAPTEFAIPAAIAASCAFMLPVATPPNAIVYGSGLVSAGRMASAGLLFNVMAVAAISVVMPTAVRLVLG